MKRSNLTPAQIDECLAVLNNERQGNHALGWVRVRCLSRAVRAWLKEYGYLAKAEDGKHYPHFCKSSCYPIFSLQNVNLWLPVDFLWRVVEPMLVDGHAGYSITAHAGWAKLNLYSRGQHGYSDANEQEIQNVLLELSIYGYIWFQFGGSVWCIDKRNDAIAAA